MSLSGMPLFSAAGVFEGIQDCEAFTLLCCFSQNGEASVADL